MPQSMRSGRVASPVSKGPDFFDSNVAIASAIPGHPHHAASAARLSKMQRSGGACSTHTLAEMYSQLTHPRRYGVPVVQALQIVERIGTTMELISLDPDETLAALASCARLGVTGGMVYDGMLVACARKIDARRIYTYNLTHFQTVAPDLASRMRLP